MTRTLLEARDLQIQFGGVVAASGVNLDVMEGENLAIIGPNGAGKTTFLNLCTGYLKPAAGIVRFLGNTITAHSPRSITRLGIARAFQIPQLFVEHSVLDNLLLAAAVRERLWNPFRRLASLPQRDEMLGLLELVGAANDAGQPVGELPEGKRKLIDIALALALKPRLLLMDEPTSGVASAEKFQVMDILSHALASRRVTAVFVEHDMEVVRRYANRVAVWNAGAITHVGEPDEVLNDPDVRRAVIGL